MMNEKDSRFINHLVCTRFEIKNDSDDNWVVTNINKALDEHPDYHLLQIMIFSNYIEIFLVNYIKEPSNV